MGAAIIHFAPVVRLFSPELSSVRHVLGMMLTSVQAPLYPNPAKGQLARSLAPFDGMQSLGNGRARNLKEWRCIRQYVLRIKDYCFWSLFVSASPFRRETFSSEIDI